MTTTTGTTITVRFDSNVDGFLQEMADRPPNVDGAVRVTRRYALDQTTNLLTHLSVLATYLWSAPFGTILVVRFKKHVGTIWPDNHGGINDGVEAKAQTLIDRITTAATDAGIQVLAGTYDNGDSK